MLRSCRIVRHYEIDEIGSSKSLFAEPSEAIVDILVPII
jgi:hypothetical protein